MIPMHSNVCAFIHRATSYMNISTRHIYSKTGKWPGNLSRALKDEIEQHWKKKLPTGNRNDQVTGKGQKYYVLSMFPYPSGNLHIGHVRVYTISDVMARYHRLTGKHVIHPMGWDAFGLPAENAAIERGEQPEDWTYSNINRMKKQLTDLCYSFDWDREYATCDAEYYKWTQYIFLKMYEHGLVYQKHGAVNWDPVDQTVLADEQVDEKGCSWRSGAPVQRKFLKQWYFRTTAYSQSLYDGLSDVDPALWKDIIALQKQWIGKCDGLSFDFDVYTQSGQKLDNPLTVFTKDAHCIYGVTHILINNQHLYNDVQYYDNKDFNETSEVTPLTLCVRNPFNKDLIPVFVHSNFDFGDFRDTHVGIPDINETDRQFADNCNLKYKQVFDKDQGLVINSDNINGLTRDQAIEAIICAAKDIKCRCHFTSERARDWLISRQRYWGTPIPMIHCPKYGTLPVKYEDLPVRLPKVSTLSGRGSSPLSQIEDWYKVKCDKCDCDSYAVRETDTMDTFVDSSWYYLRYTDPQNTTVPFSKDAAFNEMPVDLYIGGKEHAIMHLYYARFFNHFLHDLDLTPTREPFINLLTQGMVMGQSYRVKSTGKYLKREEVDFSGKVPVEKATNMEVKLDWEKMSKSKYNGVDPQDVLEKYGIDSTRLCIVAGVAPKSDRNWSDESFIGVDKWQNRIWSLVSHLLDSKIKYGSSSLERNDDNEVHLFESRNYCLKEVNHHMNSTFLLSTAISRLQILTNVLKKIKENVAGSSYEYERAVCELVIMLSPFAPLISSEMWTALCSMENKKCNFQWDKEVFDQLWPVIDEDYKLKMRVLLNSKDVYEVELDMPLQETELINKDLAIHLAQSDNQYKAVVKGHVPSRIDFNLVPGVKVDLNLVIDQLDEKKRKKDNMKKKNVSVS